MVLIRLCTQESRFTGNNNYGTSSVSNFVPIDVQLVFGAHAILYGCLVWLNFGEAIVLQRT